MNARTPDTIVLIHGLWLTSLSWEGWAEHYDRRGYRVLAPAWPGMEAGVAALNADPSAMAPLTVDKVVNHYEQLILELDRPPIIMGHSFGGTFTQILLDRGLGAAGVGLASAAVKGIKDLPFSQIRAAGPGLSPFKRGDAVALSPKEFHYAFTNTLSPEESDAIHARQAVPAPATVLQEGAFANFHRHAATEVDFRREGRAPLLLIGFGDDHLVPPSVVRHNEERYDDARSVTEYVEFPGRPHFPGAPGWEEVADRALDWTIAHTGGATPRIVH